MIGIAVDLGTTSIKGARFDGQAIDRTVAVPFPASIPGLPPGFREHDPAAIIQSFIRILDDLLDGTSGEARVLLCGQMHGYVFVDLTGRPRSTFVSWQDQRGLSSHPGKAETFWDNLDQRVTLADRKATGNEWHPGLPLCGLSWFSAASEPVAPGCYVTSLTDFVVANICGIRPSTDATNAAAFGTCQIERGDWHYELIQRLGLDAWRWPEIVRHGTIIGSASYRGRKIHFYVPVGDQPCALVGAGLSRESLSINISTGSQVSRLVDQYEAGAYQIRPYIGGGFLKTVTRIPAGRALNVLFRLVTELKPCPDEAAWVEIEERIDRVGDTDLSVNLSYFNSAFGSSGCINNVREENLSIGYLFRAAYENMAENYQRAARMIWPEEGWREILFSGGLARRSPNLRQIINARFQRDGRLAQCEEETLHGARHLVQLWQ